MNTAIPSMQDLLQAGVHFGHQVRRGNPKMGQFIYGAREGVHIIDLAKSEEKLKEATQAAYELGKQGKIMLIVGTKKQAKQIVKDLAKKVETPFLTERWVGGLLTNFDEILKNIKKILDLREQQQKGELSRYTKKEQLLIGRKIAKFENQLGGLSGMEKTPDAIFVVDAVSNVTAVKEAARMKVILLGLCDTNANPFWFDYPIPANDDGIKSIKIICETVIGAYGEGKKEGIKNLAAAVRKQEKKAAEKLAEDDKLDTPVAQEAAAIEEEVEKKVLAESERKVS